jgi:hypothetical protein
MCAVGGKRAVSVSVSTMEDISVQQGKSKRRIRGGYVDGGPGIAVGAVV